MHTELQEHLLELPLFQGMSRNDLEQILSETKFRQLSFARGKVIVHEGETCNKLFFLVKGQITTTCHSDDKSYSITETLAAPNILQPERIFGLMQRYTRTFAAKTNCDLICLGKKEVMLMSDNYEIFRQTDVETTSERHKAKDSPIHRRKKPETCRREDCKHKDGAAR